MPLLIAVLPFLGLSWLAHESTEAWFTVALIATALVGVLWGMKRHGSVRVIAAFSAAIALVVAGHFLHEHGTVGITLTAAGSFAVAGAHLLNARLGRTYTEETEQACCDH